MRKGRFRWLAVLAALAVLVQLPVTRADAAGAWSQPQQVLTLNGSLTTMSPMVLDGAHHYEVADLGGAPALLTDAGGTWQQYGTNVTDMSGTNSEGIFGLAVSAGVAYIPYMDGKSDLKLAYDPNGPANAWVDVTVVPSGAQCGPGQETEAPAAAVVGGVLAVAFDDGAPCRASTSETNDVYVAAAPISTLAGGASAWQISQVSTGASKGGVYPAVAADGAALDLAYQIGGNGGAIGFAKGTPGGANGFTWPAATQVAGTVSNQGMDRPKMTLAASGGVDVITLGAGGSQVDTWALTNASGSWVSSNVYPNNRTGGERPAAAIGVCGEMVAYTQNAVGGSQAQVMVATLAGGQWSPASVGAPEQSLDSMWPGIAATANGYDLVWVDDDSGSPVLYASSTLCPPVVTAVSPTGGQAAGGTMVTITGQALTGATTVDFGAGNAAGGVTVVSATQVTATAPAGTGTVDVTVTTPGGTSATGPADQFAYQAASGATGSASASGTAPPDGFTDLGGYDWAGAAIAALAKQGIIKGTAPGTFDPAGQVTRAQFAALTQRLFSLPAPTQPVAFNDVPQSYWGYAAVEAAAPYFDYFQVPGGGYAFQPDQAFDRQDVATVIVRLLTASGKLQVLSRADTATVLGKVTDATTIAPALQPYVATAIKAGIMAGFPDGSFQPQGLLNRAQVAVLLQRLQNSFVTVSGS